MLLTGGRDAGVMAAASQGAKSAQGLTIGILPTADSTQISAAIDLPILTGLGSARNWINVLSSQGIIACGMGAGTASEVALALKAGRRVVLLNSSPESKNFFQQLAPEKVEIADTPEDAIRIVKTDLNLQR